MKKTLLSLVLPFALLSSSSFANAADCSGTGLELEKCLSAAYLATMTAEPNAKVVDGGVVLRPIFASTSGIFPGASDTVTATYSLTDREGKVLDETKDEVAKFPLTHLIACWKTAIPMMSVGSIYKITCPSDTAYGDAGAGDGLIPGGAALTFHITLLATEK